MTPEVSAPGWCIQSRGRVPAGEQARHLRKLRDGYGGIEPGIVPDEVADRAQALGARVRHREAGELIVADSPGGFTFCLVRWHGESAVPGPLITRGDER